MEAFEQQDDDSARTEALPTISLTLATPAKRKRTSDATSSKTPSSSKRVEPIDPPAERKSHKSKAKSKDQTAAVPEIPPAAVAMSSASAPGASSTAAEPPTAAGPSSTPASSLAFAAVALAQAKRDEDSCRKKERRSKSGAEEDRSSSTSSEKEKDRAGESKEERKKRKEEKRRRKEEKERKKAAEAEAGGGKERKHKSKDGDEHKKSKKHKRKASELADGDAPAAEVAPKKAKTDATDAVATNFSAVVTNFMAGASSSATTPATTPVKEKKKKRSKSHGEGGEDGQAGVGAAADVNGSADAVVPSTPKTPKSKKDKKKDRAAPAVEVQATNAAPAALDIPIAAPSSPEPSHDPMEAPSSPEPDRDPMDASSSPEPDRDPMEASSSPTSATRPRVILSATQSPSSSSAALPAASPSKTAPRTSTGRTAEEIAAAWSSKASAAASSSKAPAKAAKAPAKPRKKKDEADVDVDAEDEALRERLKDPNELNEFLSSRWIDIPVLQRLEKKGIVTWKRGKYTEAERAAVRAHLDTFMRTHSMEDSDLVDIIFAKGRGSARSKYPGFWAEVAAQVPGRPLRYVKEAVQRMYHPNAHKGAWTKEEDEALQRAYTETPDQWVRIGDAVGRSYIDCRDRYKKQIEVSKERVSGRWSKTEEEQLKEAVKAATAELGKDMMSPDIPWPVVAKLMGGNRSFHQCRVKWQEHMVPMLRGALYGASASSVLAAIRKLGYEHENDIVWREVGNEANSHVKSAQATWRRMLQAVAPVDGKSLVEILALIDARIDELEDDISTKASATAARSERAKKAAARRQLERERTETTRRERTQWVEEARSREPSWLEAAGAAVSQAEAWMDGVVASRAVSRTNTQDGLLSVGGDRSRSRSVSGSQRKVSFAADT